MKASLLIATLVAVVALAELHAQQQPPRTASPAGSPGVAVIDISYIFKNHIRFKQSTEIMKRDVEMAEATLKKERDLINQLIEKLKDFRPGTPDYKKLEEDITQRQADFQVRASLQKKEFLERESKIFYNVYQEINDEVKYFSDHNGISLVMRFNGDPVDLNNRDSVLREINKPIVYSKGIDITPMILKTLNDRAGNVNATGNGTATRPNGPVAPIRRN